MSDEFVLKSVLTIGFWFCTSEVWGLSLGQCLWGAYAVFMIRVYIEELK